MGYHTPPNLNRMGYLQELQQELRALLGDMDEAKQKELALWVGKKVLESYRNGQATVQAMERLAGVEKKLVQAGKRFLNKNGSRA